MRVSEDCIFEMLQVSRILHASRLVIGYLHDNYQRPLAFFYRVCNDTESICHVRELWCLVLAAAIGYTVSVKQLRYEHAHHMVHKVKKQTLWLPPVVGLADCKFHGKGC